METCKNCIWWGKESGKGVAPCTNPGLNVTPESAKKRTKKDVLIVDVSGYAWVSTGEDFGCIRHKEKK